MISDVVFKALKSESRHFPTEVDHFSIEKVGSKFYVYAHPLKSRFNRKKIGTYPTYEAAKAVVDMVLDAKLATKTTDKL